MAVLEAELKAKKNDPPDSEEAFRKMVRPVLEKKSVRKHAEAACLSVEELED